MEVHSYWNDLGHHLDRCDKISGQINIYSGMYSGSIFDCEEKHTVSVLGRSQSYHSSRHKE